MLAQQRGCELPNVHQLHNLSIWNKVCFERSQIVALTLVSCYVIVMTADADADADADAVTTVVITILGLAEPF